MGTFAEVEALLKYVAEHADPDTGFCTVPSTECLDAFEAVFEVNAAGWCESLEIVDLRTVRVKDRGALDTTRCSIHALHILERP